MKWLSSIAGSQGKNVQPILSGSGIRNLESKLCRSASYLLDMMRPIRYKDIKCIYIFQKERVIS